MKVSYLNNIAEERTLRLKGRMVADPHALILWTKALHLVPDPQQRILLNTAYKFAGKIDYNHEGLSSAIYFAHPLRVAALSILSQQGQNIDAGIVGLLHNVFELSSVSPVALSALFGEEVVKQITDLTVNRHLQWDLDYKKAYYQKINDDPLSCRIVKIFDKLDNLFVLGLNAHEDVRSKYLLEIETHILPMADRDIPELRPYLELLVKECSVLGFIDDDKIKLWSSY